MNQPKDIDFSTLKPDEFENYLPELFAAGNGKVSEDPRLKEFLTRNPDCAALVRDLETIAETARSLFEPVEEPSDQIWRNIQEKLHDEPTFNDDALPDGLARVD